MKVSFFGIGQCGSNICEIAELYEYRTIILNTSPEDLEAISLIKNKLLVGDNGGCGKDRKVGKAEVKKYYKKIVQFAESKLSDDDIELVCVVFSTGGGTGSGMGPMITDLLTRTIPGKKFMAIAVIPSLKESPAAQANTLECLTELERLQVPVMIVDNDQYHNDNMTRKQMYDTINNGIIDAFNDILDEREASKYGNIDRRDIINMLSTVGCTTITTVDMNAEPELPFGKKVFGSLENSIYARPEFDGVVKSLGFIVEVEDRNTKGLNYDEVVQELGKPIEIFEGFYSPVDNKEQVTIIAAGMSYPETRLAQISELLEKTRTQMGTAKTSSVLSGDNSVAWLNSARSESKSEVKPVAPVTSGEFDLDDFFDKY